MPETKPRLNFLYIFVGFVLVIVGVDAFWHRNWIAAFGMFMCSYICFAAGFGGIQLMRLAQHLMKEKRKRDAD